MVRTDCGWDDAEMGRGEGTRRCGASFVGCQPQGPANRLPTTLATPAYSLLLPPWSQAQMRALGVEVAFSTLERALATAKDRPLGAHDA